MRSLRFLLSRRWLAFALIVVLLGYGAWALGEWQFGRLADRKDSNAVVRANEHKDPAPVADVLAPGRPVDEDHEWRVVTATGTYATEDTVIVRYRTREGSSGIDVVVPLVTDDGTALLVDRGWLATDNQGAGPADVPDPPAGRVDVQGWVRADAEGDSTVVEDKSTRAISSERIGAALGRSVYTGFVVLKSEDGRPAEALEPVELPELDNGPHFFYGLQWWFFGVLSVFGFLYLAFDEWRSRQRGEGQAPASAPAAGPAPGAPAGAGGAADGAGPDKARRRSAKNAKKQAIRAAYERAWEEERRQRDRGTSSR